MKRLVNISLCVFITLSLILSIAFIVIEGRLLFSGDYLVYNTPFNGFIRYLFRFLLALFVLGKSILDYVYLNKQGSIKEYLFYSDIGLIYASIVVLLNSTNYVGVILLTLTSVIALIKLLKYKLEKQSK